MSWLDPSELRVGLGCMRLSTDARRDDDRAIATIRAAADAGVSVFDTARAYAPDPSSLGHNERLLSQALSGRPGTVRVVTKGGMTRPGGAWVPDGRAKAIRSNCEGSLEALGGVPIDLYLLHTPDPRTSWSTSLRALARIADEGLVARVGVSNVNRRQLEQACDLVPVSAVQVALSVVDERALRGGIVELCAERGIALIAHSPLGGPRRAAGLAQRPELTELAAAHGVRPAEIALAWLLALPGEVVAIAGARRPETAISGARAASLQLPSADLERLEAGRARPQGAGAGGGSDPGGGEVVVVMGIPGAGKSRIATDYAGREYVRLNRDELGGSLRAIADRLERELSGGVRRVVLDNTYLTRAARSYVLDAAARHGLPVRCIWLDTPLAQAQVNLVERLLVRFGELPAPAELRAAARHEPGLMLPTSQMRTLRELEPPSLDEGFDAVERVPFAREPSSRAGTAGVLVAAPVLTQPGAGALLASFDPSAPHLVFDWRPDGSEGDLAGARAGVARLLSGPLEVAVCPHGGGPPSCWCRPPLPGLALAFARRHALDPAALSVVGASPAHRTLARTLGARYLDAAITG